MRVLSFHVHGTPQPKGSWRAFVPRGRRRANFVPDNPKTKDWCSVVGNAAMAAVIRGNRAAFPLTGAVWLDLTFVFPRPKRPCDDHIVKPDLDKLVRAVFDALTGIVYCDDAQVTRVTPVKVYAAPDGLPGLWVNVYAHENCKGERKGER